MTTWKLRTWKLRLSAALVAACICPIQMASAQQAQSTAELKKDIDSLKTSLTAIQKDLQDIKALLQSRPQGAPAQGPGSVVLDLGGRPVRGSAKAKLTLVEFSDYQCPFCERHTRETSPQIAKEYIETGKVRQVFMDFPLESIHKNAFKGAEAARCAGEQGKYWEMHDELFSNQKTLTEWTAHAQAVGLKVEQFDSCLANGKFDSEIRKDMAQGQAGGITGTPGFFLALTDPTSAKVKTVRFISGAQPYAAFKAQIDALLADPGEGAKKP